MLIAPENCTNGDDARQSPINIPISCECDMNLHSFPLNFGYETRGRRLLNTGKGFQVNFDRSMDSLLEGGPLDSKYRLEQLHCHWGKDNSIGSEHTIDGKTYPSEMHLVHWNYEKYRSIEQAVDKPDGLAVLGIFLEVGEEHYELEKVCELLPKIPHLHDQIPMEMELNPMEFFPVRRAYWTYPGSLTIPPYDECVQWILFKDPIQVSEKQLESFRTLLNYGRLDKVPEDECCGKILTNYRPTSDLGNRIVRRCGSRGWDE